MSKLIPERPRYHRERLIVGFAVLAVFALQQGVSTAQVRNDPALFQQFAVMLEANGIQRYWKK